MRAKHFINKLTRIPSLTALICVYVEQKVISKIWSPLMIRSCNEVLRPLSSVDIGFTFNPYHLYTKLLKYQYSRNYEILRHWRRASGSTGREIK